jgi:hypothetical protein
VSGHAEPISAGTGAVFWWPVPGVCQLVLVGGFGAGPVDAADGRGERLAVLGPHACAALTGFARSEQLEAAQITAVGAFERATVGWFDRAAKDYRRIQVDEQCELLSLIGDVAEGEDGPILHAHVVLGLSDGTTRGGHLLEGRVSRRWRPS